MLEKLNKGDYIGAAEQFPCWNKGGGEVMMGLVRRRADERNLFLKK
ncbi:glycoside hydrolase family protein [Acinetobacter calcoaceticus]